MINEIKVPEPIKNIVVVYISLRYQIMYVLTLDFLWSNILNHSKRLTFKLILNCISVVIMMQRTSIKKHNLHSKNTTTLDCFSICCEKFELFLYTRLHTKLYSHTYSDFNRTPSYTHGLRKSSMYIFRRLFILTS